MGLCSPCYRAALRKHTTVRCSVADCDRPEEYTTGKWPHLCDRHYQLARLGRPLDTPARVPKGSLGRVWNGYVRLPSVGGRQRYEHREVMAEMLGRPLTRDDSVHHKNGDRADNRPENLELWYRGQPAGQRVDDLVAFVVERYPQQVLAKLVESWDSEPKRHVRLGIRGRNG